MQCLIYARVSTDKQVEKELSIPAQLQAMRQYAEQRGWSVLEEFIEPGASARTAERPVLHRLLARCRESMPKIDVVVVHKLDRLARNLSDHIAIRATLKKAGVQLVSVMENLEDSVSGHLVENIMASLAEFYSANLSEEIRKGMTQRVRQGGWPHPVPLGYRRRHGDPPRAIELDPELAPILQFAFESVATDLYSLKTIAITLRDRGLPLRRNDLGRILRNPFYCGRLRWSGGVFEGRHPALVSAALFDRVQGVLKARAKALIRFPERYGPLHGFAQCAACGTRVGSERHGEHRYYRCRSNMRVDGRCDASFMNQQKVHDQLSSIYRALAVSPELRRRIRGLQDEHTKAAAFDRRHRRELEIAATVDRRTREQRLAHALGSGLMEPEVYRVALDKIRQERPIASEAVSAAMSSWPATSATSILELHLQLAPAERRALAILVFKQIAISDGGIERHELCDSVAA